MSEVQSHVNSSIVAVYPDHEAAERAVRQLHEAGIPMCDLSIIGRGSQTTEEPVGFVTAGDYASAGAATGAWFGGLLGLCVGAAFLVLPGIGPIVVAGPCRRPCWQESKERSRGRHSGSSGRCPGWLGCAQGERRSNTRRTSKGASSSSSIRSEPGVVARAQSLLTDHPSVDIRPLRSVSVLKSIRR